jgi:hypothetical protein
MVINTATIAKRKVTLQEIAQNRIVVVESLMKFTRTKAEIVDVEKGVLHTLGVSHIRVAGVEEETVKAVVKKVEEREVEEMTTDVIADAQIAEIGEEVQAEIGTEGGHQEVETEEKSVEVDQEMKEDQIADAALHVVEVEAMTGVTGDDRGVVLHLKTLYVIIVKKEVIMLTIVLKKNKSQSAIIVKSQVTWLIIAQTQESNELLYVTIVTKKATWREIVRKREDKHAIIEVEKYLMEKEMDVRQVLVDPVHVTLVLVHLDPKQASVDQVLEQKNLDLLHQKNQNEKSVTLDLIQKNVVQVVQDLLLLRKSEKILFHGPFLTNGVPVAPRLAEKAVVPHLVKVTVDLQLKINLSHLTQNRKLHNKTPKPNSLLFLSKLRQIKASLKSSNFQRHFTEVWEC